MNVRVAVRGVLWVLGAGCLFLPVLDDPPLQSGACVQDVRRDSAVVAMMTAAPATLQLEVTDRGGGKNAPDELPFMVEMAPARRHVLRMSGLQPGHRYEFIVREVGGAEVDRGSFRTPSEDDRALVRFDVVGDSGALPTWVWLQTSPLLYLPARWGWLPPQGRVSRMGEQLLEDHPDFVLHVGDVVYPWGHAGHYQQAFFRPFAGVLRSAPCYAALGNHDVLDDDGRQLLANFVMPVNEVTGDARMYSIVWGPVRVVVFDGNLDGADRRLLEPVNENHPSMQFLRRELAAATEPWLMVASHFPIESASRQRDRQDLIRHVLPLLRDYGVNLYLSGHDHTYQRLGKRSDPPMVVSGGGGKSLYEVSDHADRVVAWSKYNHCLVQVEGRDLTLRAIGLEGEQLDEFKLQQDADAAARAREVNPARALRIEKLLK